MFDVRVETLSGDTFEVTMGSDYNKVLALKRKISKQHNGPHTGTVVLPGRVINGQHYRKPHMPICPQV